MRNKHHHDKLNSAPGIRAFKTVPKWSRPPGCGSMKRIGDRSPVGRLGMGFLWSTCVPLRVLANVTTSQILHRIAVDNHVILSHPSLDTRCFALAFLSCLTGSLYLMRSFLWVIVVQNVVLLR